MGCEVAAKCTDDFLGGHHGLCIDIHGKNLGALLGETHGGGQAIAPSGPDTASAGDDGHFVGQSQCGLMHVLS